MEELQGIRVPPRNSGGEAVAAASNGTPRSLCREESCGKASNSISSHSMETKVRAALDSLALDKQGEPLSPSTSSLSPTLSVTLENDIEHRVHRNREPFLIGVTGGTASGKTTVCEQIIHALSDQRVVLISQDSFYFSLTEEQIENVKAYNFDHPQAFDWKAVELT